MGEGCRSPLAADATELLKSSISAFCRIAGTFAALAPAAAERLVSTSLTFAGSPAAITKLQLKAIIRVTIKSGADFQPIKVISRGQA